MTANPSVDPSRFLDEHLSQASPDLMRPMPRTFAEALMGSDADADAVRGAAWP